MSVTGQTPHPCGEYRRISPLDAVRAAIAAQRHSAEREIAKTKKTLREREMLLRDMGAEGLIVLIAILSVIAVVPGSASPPAAHIGPISPNSPSNPSLIR
jgi:hypothetical protein